MWRSAQKAEGNHLRGFKGITLGGPQRGRNPLHSEKVDIVRLGLRKVLDESDHGVDRDGKRSIVPVEFPRPAEAARLRQ